MATRMVRKGLYLTPELFDDLRDYAHEHRQTDSDVVRQALANHLYTDPDDAFEINQECRDAIIRLSEDKNVAIDKCIDAIIRKQIPKYFE